MSAPNHTEASVGTSPRDRLRGLSRWGRRALIASLALNLLFIGMAASAMWRHRKDGPFALSAVNANLLGFSSTLPPERRQALWRQTASERRSMRPLRAEMRQARDAVRAAFLVEPFDAAEFNKVQARLLDAEIRARSEAQKLFFAIASSLTQEERAAFARWEPPTGERSHRSGKGWFHRGTTDGNGDASPHAPRSGTEPVNPR